jgi:hypothetical protein
MCKGILKHPHNPRPTISTAGHPSYNNVHQKNNSIQQWYHVMLQANRSNKTKWTAAYNRTNMQQLSSHKPHVTTTNQWIPGHLIITATSCIHFQTTSFMDMNKNKFSIWPKTLTAKQHDHMVLNCSKVLSWQRHSKVTTVTTEFDQQQQHEHNDGQSSWFRQQQHG